MNNKKLLRRVFVFILITLLVLLTACGLGQLFGPTLTPTPTPLPTSTPTPTPIPLSQIDLSKIALQPSDLSSNFQRTENSTSTTEQNVINFYSVSFGWSTTGIGNVIRVFENETLASQFFQTDINDVSPDNRIDIPMLGDEAVASRFELLGIKTVMIAWRYKETYIFLRYASQEATSQLMVDESIRLAQQIDARLKKSNGEVPAIDLNTPEAVALPTQDTSFGKVYVSDAFNDNSNEWSVGDVDGDWWVGTLLIENGVLDWDGISRQAMFSHQFPGKASLQEKFTGMQVSSKVKLLNPTMDGYYGITLRATDENEQMSFYAFVVSGGNYSFLLYADQEYKTLIDWQENPDINNGDWNKLTVQAVGSHFSLFINDNLLAETDDATLPNGQGGVIIGTWGGGEKIQVQFDDFEVRLPSPSSTSADTPTLPPAPANWNGIPIMSDAFTGQEDMGDYQFTTKASAEEIKKYYEREMANLGWELRPEMMASIPTDLAFKKSGTFVFFKIDPEGNNNVVMIHIVQQ
jgi:hypothetical protein